jgi:hypothetical protein
MRTVLLLAALLAACKKEPPPPTCDQISDHMLDVTKQALPGHDPSYLGDRKAMVAQCEKRNPSREVRNCLMKATTLPALGECQANGKKPEPQPTRPLPTTPTPEAPAPAQPATPSGSGS